MIKLYLFQVTTIITDRKCKRKIEYHHVTLANINNISGNLRFEPINPDRAAIPTNVQNISSKFMGMIAKSFFILSYSLICT